MSDRLEEALIKWNAQLALKARKRLARGEARSEAECVTPGQDAQEHVALKGRQMFVHPLMMPR